MQLTIPPTHLGCYPLRLALAYRPEVGDNGGMANCRYRRGTGLQQKRDAPGRRSDRFGVVRAASGL